MYNASYLPISKKDIQDISFYISDTLNAPGAALDLVDALDKAVSLLEQFPYTHRVYKSPEPLEYEYRVMFVKNYAVFYVVDEDRHAVEIHRVIYAKRDLQKALMPGSSNFTEDDLEK